MTAIRLLCLFVLALCVTPIGLSDAAQAQDYPSAAYSEEIPTLEDVVGHDHGEAISSVTEIRQFLDALAEAAPDRMRVQSYGETWQGRELIYAVISSPENMARLNAIQSDLSQLAAGDAMSAADRDRIIGDTPAVVWLSYGVHGDEITPPDSSLRIAYHLLAAQNDPLVDQILSNTIVIIDPSQNPDGRDRFVHSFESSLGLEPIGDRYSAEHDQPWPRGRYNHYMFDLNRDWFALTQPETQGKVRAVQQWNPVVYVDSHEMSGDSTYFFAPPARPLNPLITEEQRRRLVDMGRNHANWFDRFGVPYFTREVYDAFYPGYGDMWPTLNGATAMTYEQGSPRGLVFDRRDGTQLSYADGVRNNFLTSLSTLEVVARDKTRYLREFADYRRSAVENGRTSDDRFVVMNLVDRPYEAYALAGRLSDQGIKVQATPKGSRHCGATFSDGALIVDLAQPNGRLARTLLAPSTDLAEDYIKEQEERRKAGLNHELYDVTAWSLPLIGNLSAQMCRQVDLSDATTLSPKSRRPADISGDPRFGYAVPWSDGGQARLVIDALKAGLKGKSTDKAFVKDGRTFPAGTVIFPQAGNPDDHQTTLRRLAEKHGATLVGMPSSWVEDGPNFGSDSFKSLRSPKIAMAWGEGTRATSAGNTRFVLERQLGLPVAPIRLSTLASADLSLYDVLILPDMQNRLPQEAVRTFVRNGGVVVGLERALVSLSSGDEPLLATKREYAAQEEDNSSKSDEDEDSRAEGLIFETKEDYAAYIKDHSRSPEDIPGVLAKAEADQNHWLAAGYDSTTAMVTGRDIYRPLNLQDGTNVFTFAGADEFLLSGYLWEENRQQMAHKPFVMAQPVGDGVVIGITQDPTLRAFMDGLNLLLANAVLLGPANVSQ